MKLALTILEYIFLPLAAIMASFELKKRLKVKPLTVEEFLEELNVDIMVICALGIFSFGVSCSLHNDNDNTKVYILSLMTIIFSLCCYITIHYLKILKYNVQGYQKKPKYFGIRNAVYRDSSWFVLVLILYVLVGTTLKNYIFHEHVSYPLVNTVLFAAFGIFLIWACPWLFFFLLNKMSTRFLLSTELYQNTYSLAYMQEKNNEPGRDDAVKKYSLLLATLDKHNPLIIAVYQRLAETYEAKKDVDLAEMYMSKLIDLLGDEKLNHSKDYLIDAYLELLDFYFRNKKIDKWRELKEHIKTLFPEDERTSRL